MKLYFKSFQKGISDWRERCVWMVDSRRYESTDEGITEKIDKILRSPYSFDASGISFLEKQKLSSKNKRRLNQIAEFHISLIASRSDITFPSRVLFEMKESTLWRFLNPGLKNNIKALFSDQVKRSEGYISKSVGALSSTDLTNMTRLYRFMRTSNSKDTDTFQKLADKLLEKAQSIINNYQISQEGVDIFAENLSARDRLFVLEIQELFPSQVELQKIDKSHVLSTIGNLVIKKLSDDFNSSEFKNKLEYLPLWEVLASLNRGQIDAEALPNFEAMIKQSQAAQFMGWIDNWRKSSNGFVLLPEHIKALQDIKKDADKLAGNEELKRVVGDFEDTPEGKKKFEDFLVDWEKDKEHFYKEETSSEGKKKRRKINIGEARKEFEKNYESIDKIIDAFKQTRDELKKNSIIKRLYKIDGFKTKWDEALYEGDTDRLRNDITAQGNETPYDRLKEKLDFKKIREFLSESNEESIQGVGTEEISEARRLINTFEQTPVGEDFKNKKRQAKQKIEDDINYVSKNQEKLSEHVKMARQLFYKGENAEKYLKEYKKGLKGRSANHRLEAADLAVLYEKSHLSNPDENPSGLTPEDQDFVNAVNDALESELSEKILEFREAFKKHVIAGLLDDAKDGNTLTTERGFVTWLEQLNDKAILENDNLKNILDELKELLAVSIYDRTDESTTSSLTIKEILDATKTSFKDQILKEVSPILSKEFNEKVEGVLGESKQTELQNFLHYYDRTHQTLYDLDQDHKKKTFDKYVNEKRSFDRFEDGLKQRNNEAVGGVTREKLIHYIYEKTGIPKNDIELGLSFLNAETYKRDILEGNLSSVKNTLNNIPGMDKVLSAAPKEEREKFIFNVGRLIAKVGANHDFNKVVEGQTAFLLHGDEKFPGFETMNDMSLQLSPLTQEVNNLHERFGQKIKDISLRISGEKSGSKISMRDLEQELFSDWEDNIKPRLEYVSSDAEALLNDIFPDQKEHFNRNFIQNFKSKINFFQEYVDVFRESYKGKDLEGPASVKDLENLLTGFSDIPRAFNIDTGQFHKMQVEATESLKHVPDTLAYVQDELGMLEPGGKEKAKKNFEALKKKYKPVIDTYLLRAEKNGKRLEYDLKKLDEDRFRRIYGVDKSKGQKQLQDLKDSSFNFLTNFSGQKELESFASRTGWENDGSKPDTDLGKTGFFERGFFDQWFHEYSSGDPQKMNEAISDMNVFSGMANENYMKEVKKQNNQLQKFTKDYDEFEKNNPDWRNAPIKSLIGAPVRLWKGFQNLSWHWFSIMDIYQMAKDFMEVWERERKKIEEQAVAALGSKIFGDSAIGKEFARRAEEAEETRVGEYKKRMEDKPAYAWRAVLYRTSNQDEARAMMDLLSEAGQLRWDDPGLLRTLNRLQNKIKFNIPEDIVNQSYSQLSKMIGQACLEPLWSKKVFDNWDQSQKGNFKKGLEQHDKNFQNLVDEKGITQALGSMLERWESGDDTVNPLEFANYLYQAFKVGEINGPEDPRWFYLIVGARLENPQGKTLLPKDFFIFMKGELRAEVPYFDFFTEKSADYWMKDGRLVPKGTPGGHPGSDGWNNSDIDGWVNFLRKGVSSFSDESSISKRSVDFFYQFVTTSPNARIRLDKQGRKLGSDSDHDDAWMQSAGISYNNMTQALNKKSEGADIMSQPWANSFLDGFPRAIESLYRDIEECQKIYGDVPGWEEAKNQKLIDIGERIRIGFIAAQTLSGNVHDNTSQHPMILDIGFWNDPNSSANQARNTLTDMVGGIVSGEVEGFDSVKGWVGIKEYGSSNFKEIQKLPGFSPVNTAILDARNSSAFNDPRKIEAMLRRQIGLSGSVNSGTPTRNWDFKNLEKAA